MAREGGCGDADISSSKFSKSINSQKIEKIRQNCLIFFLRIRTIVPQWYQIAQDLDYNPASTPSKKFWKPLCPPLEVPFEEGTNFRVPMFNIF